MNLDNVKNVWQQQNSGTEAAIKINQEMLSVLKVNEQMKAHKKYAVCTYY